MDGSGFAAGTRRRLGLAVGGLASALLALAAARVPGATEARKRKKKPKFNNFGCLSVGKACRKANQCCSGICKGKQGKNVQRCKGHDSGGCTAGDHSTVCGGASVPCLSSAGEDGVCATTTGNAGYCFGAGIVCTPCRKDADCQSVCGPAAACAHCSAACAGFGGTMCVGPTACE